MTIKKKCFCFLTGLTFLLCLLMPSIGVCAEEDPPSTAPEGYQDLGFAAAGEVVEDVLLQPHQTGKTVKTNHMTDIDDGKQHLTGIQEYEWSLWSRNYTQGNSEYVDRQWDDMMWMSALLDAAEAEEVNAGFGDDSLNEAWVQLFFKHIRFTEFTVTECDTLGGADDETKMDLVLSGEKGNEMVFVPAEGSKFHETVTITMDALEYDAETGEWKFRKTGDSFTDTEKKIWDMWGIGVYTQKYWTKEEISKNIDRYADTSSDKDKANGIVWSEMRPFGYGSSRPFHVDVENDDYLRGLDIVYKAYIDWDELYEEADRLFILPEFVQYCRTHRSTVGNDVLNAVNWYDEREQNLAEISESLGLTDEDALHTGLPDLPRWRQVLNAGISDGGVDLTGAKWEYGPSAGGSLEKTVTEADDGGLIWNAVLSVGNADFVNYMQEDFLQIPEGLSEKLDADSAFALPFEHLAWFELVDAATDTVLYHGDADDYAQPGSSEGFYDNAELELNTEDGLLYRAKFGRICGGVKLAFRYKTELNLESYFAAGGVFGTEIAVENYVTGDDGLHKLEASGGKHFTPEDESSFSKRESDYGLASEKKFTLDAEVGNADLRSMQISDGMSATSLVTPDPEVETWDGALNWTVGDLAKRAAGGSVLLTGYKDGTAVGYRLVSRDSDGTYVVTDVEDPETALSASDESKMVTDDVEQFDIRIEHSGTMQLQAKPDVLVSELVLKLGMDLDSISAKQAVQHAAYDALLPYLSIESMKVTLKKDRLQGMDADMFEVSGDDIRHQPVPVDSTLQEFVQLNFGMEGVLFEYKQGEAEFAAIDGGTAFAVLDEMEQSGDILFRVTDEDENVKLFTMVPSGKWAYEVAVVESEDVTLAVREPVEEEPPLVIFDSAAEIDDLAAHGFSFNEGFALNENGIAAFDLVFDCAANTDGALLPAGYVVVVEYVVKLDTEAMIEAGCEAGAYEIQNHAVMLQDGGVKKELLLDSDYPVHPEPLTKTGTVIKDEKDAYGNETVTVRWDIDLYMDELFTNEELAAADPDTAAFTDVLFDSTVMKYVDGSLALYNLDADGKAQSAVPEEDYTFEIKGKRICVELHHLADHAMVRMSLATQINMATAPVSNSISVELLGKTLKVDSEPVDVQAKANGYIKSRNKLGHLTVVKTDARTGEVLPLTEFYLYNVTAEGETLTPNLVAGFTSAYGEYSYDTQEVEEFWTNREGSPLVTDADGQIVISNLPFGTYKLVEQKQLSGYENFDEKGDHLNFTFTVDDDSLVYDEEHDIWTASYEWKALNQPVELYLHKSFTKELAGKEIGWNLSNVKFAVYQADSDGNVIEPALQEGVTDEDGMLLFDYLAAGDYVVREVQPPKGFEAVAEFAVHVDADGYITVDDMDLADGETVELSDELVTGQLKLHKTGILASDLGMVEKLKGYLVHGIEWLAGSISDVTFEFHAAEDVILDGHVVYEKDELVGTAVTDASGIAQIGPLPEGAYYAVETAAKDSDIVVDAKKIYFTLTLKEEGGIWTMDESEADEEAVNARKRVKVTLTKTDEADGKGLSGAVFGLYSKVDQYLYHADEMVDVVVTGDDGVGIFDTVLPNGSYYVKELEAPIGYLLSDETKDVDEAVVFTAEKDYVGEDSVAFSDTGRSLFIYKQDEAGEPVIGATLRLEDASGVEVDTWVTESVPHELYGIAVGTYTLRELQPAAGYATADPVTVVIDADDDEANLGVYRAYMTDKELTISVTKTDAITGAIVPGASLQIVDSEGIVKDSWVSDGRAHTVKKLPAGKYTLEETNAPAGYLKADPVEFTVLDTEDVQNVEIADYTEKHGGVTLHKADAADGKAVPGAKFLLYEVMSGTETPVTGIRATTVPGRYVAGTSGHVNTTADPLVTGTDGALVVDGLPLGSYVLREVQPAPGYMMAANADGFAFTLDDNNVKYDEDTGLGSYMFTFHATNAHSLVKAVKRDVYGGAVAGAQLAVYTQNADGSRGVRLDGAVSAKDGSVTFDGLEPGNYLLVEEKAPDGYVTAKDVPFTVDKYGVAAEVKMTDDVTKADLSKKDLTNGQELPGAKLTVKREDGTVVESWVSGDMPHRIEKLPVGRYTLVEETAPDGYVTAESVEFTITDDGAVVPVEMKDDVTKLTVSKKDITNGQELPGAKLEIRDANGKVVDSWTSSSEPHYVEKLPVGWYTLTETSTPDGYATSETVTFEVKDTGEIQSVEMTDDITKLYVSKLDEYGNQLSGARLAILDSEGNTVDEWTTDGSRHYLEKLPVGEYVLRELEAPAGYTLADDMPFTVHDTGDIQSVAMSDAVTSATVEKLDLQTGKALSGAVLEVHNSRDEIVDRWTTDGTVHSLAGLPAGRYTLMEAKPAAGYVTAEPVPFTVEFGKGSDTKVVMEDDVTKLSISKKDMTNGEELPGAKLTLKDQFGNVVDEWVSGSEPHYVEKLPVGVYTLTETTAPDGYVTSESVRFEVKDTGEIQKAEMFDDVTKVQISKKDITDGEELPGAKLSIVDENGNVVEEWVSGETPHYIEKLPVGRYTLIEERAPEGYVTAESVVFDVLDSGEVTKVEMTDDVTKVRISKKDITNGEELPGAKLTIRDADGNVVGEWVSGKEPHYIEKLPFGTYTLTEEQVPAGYVTSETVTFTVTDDGTVVDVEMKDDVTKVQISKKDMTNGEELPGAKLTLRDANGNIVDEWTSGEDAHYIEKLPVGEYTLTEETAPDGYVRAETITFTVDDTGEIQKVEMLDDVTKVQISKQDITNGQELPGARLVLKDANGNIVDEWTSSTTPHYIEKLKPGTYTLTEITAPNGYEVAETVTFTVSETGEVQTVTMFDRPSAIETEAESTKPVPSETETDTEEEQETEEETEAKQTEGAKDAPAEVSNTGKQDRTAPSVRTWDVSYGIWLILGIGFLALAGALTVFVIRRRK